MRLTPAPAGTGIVFRRVDLDNFELRADVGSVERVAYATTLMSHGVWISTVEHLLSAFYALGIDNAYVELDNFEAAKKMLEEGLGVALLPAVAVARELELGQLASVPILDAGPIHRRMVAIRRNDVGPAGGIATAFLELLQAMVGTLPSLRSTNGLGSAHDADHAPALLALGSRPLGAFDE